MDGLGDSEGAGGERATGEGGGEAEQEPGEGSGPDHESDGEERSQGRRRGGIG
ncbi:MAG: hypothetical protein HZA54_09155 [Planctomycetes bacterium]|nr:hypothetical protein [Planctomycetota bacterium]